MSEVTTTPSTAGEPRSPAASVALDRSPALELDTRLLGMIVALGVIWIVLQHPLGRERSSRRGTCGTCRSRAPRSRSWPRAWSSSSCRATSTCRSGRCSASSATIMAMIQADLAPPGLRARLRPALHLDRRARRRARDRRRDRAALRASIVAYVGVPSFIVTLGGLLVWRGLIFRFAAGPDARPARRRSSSSSAAARRDRSARPLSWILGILACVGDHLHAVVRPAPQAALRLPGPAAVGRGRGRRHRLRRGARRRLRRQQLHVAARPRRPVRPRRTASRSRPAADPDRHRRSRS